MAVTLPKAPTPKKNDLRSLTVLLHGGKKIGKCLSGDTLIYDANSCKPVTIREIVESSTGVIHTMKEAGCIVPVIPSHFLRNEPEQLYRLLTQTGRTIEATAHHPFLTRDGWKKLLELTPSDRVAVVAEYPDLFGNGEKMDDELIKIMAYLIADGSLMEGKSPIFTKNDLEVRSDFEAAVESKGDECIEFFNKKGIAHVRIRGKQRKPNNVIKHLKEVGLHGLRSREKFIPEFVFGLCKGKLSLFLNRLFTCDGCVEATGRVSFSSTSVRMVHQTQHLLLRFGIVSVVREKYLHGGVYGAELLIASKNDVLRFLDQIGVIGEKACRAEAIRTNLYNVRATGTQLDRVGHILFDRVISITPVAVEPVYDLTIPEYHNFIANDFVVHNSSFCAGMPNVVYAATEPGLGQLEVHQVPIQSWQDFIDFCNALVEEKHDFQTVVIDTINNLYAFACRAVCEKHKVEYVGDFKAIGKGHVLANNLFYETLLKLANQPLGLWMIAHSVEKEIETRTEKYLKAVPQLPDKAAGQLLGMADLILYADLHEERDEDDKSHFKRVLRTKPSKYYEAGDRSGLMPSFIDLDYGKFAEVYTTAIGTSKASSPKPASGAKQPAAPKMSDEKPPESQRAPAAVHGK